MESKITAQAKVDQDRWVIEIMEGLNIHEEEEKEFFICVFNVPKVLLAAKPEAYIPQSVSIGPYHHWRSELYEMERYKLAVARRFQKRVSGLKFERVAEELRKHDQQIRSCYHKYLDYTDEALAWLMALDAAFLLECLQFYVKQTDEASSEVPSLGKVLDPTGKSAAHNAILRDLMMLENQIPLFLFQKLLEMQFGLGSEEKAAGRLCNLVSLACVQLSPFKYNLPDNSKLRIKERSHLLDVLYYSIVSDPTAANSANSAKDGNEDEKKQEPLPDTAYIAQAFSLLWKVLSSLNVGPVRRLTDLSQSLLRGKAVQFVMKLPLCLLSTLKNLPVLAPFKGHITFLLGSSTADKDEDDKDGDAQSSLETPPTRDELAIPSVSDLYSVGIKFLPTNEGLWSIRFDQTTATLYLPTIKLDHNTEVILRNLVAYEATAAPGAFILARYIDFVNGIVDEKEDVCVLRNSGIIYNHLESDGKAASLWNGMGKCVKLTKVQHLDQVIADVNTFYNRRWSVAVKKYVNKYIFELWQFLSLLAVAILLLVTCLQSFCSVYECKRWFSDTTFLQD